MRRTRIILASLAAVVGVTLFAQAPPASSHFCANPVELRVGTKGAVNIGIAAEEKPVTGVDVGIPVGFTLDHPVEYGPWKVSLVGARAEFRGGRIEPYTCAFFSVVGTATRKGAYAFPLTTHAEDGSVRRYTSTKPFDPSAAQMVYAGVPIPDATGTTTTGSKGFLGGYGWALLAAIGVGGLAVGVAVLVERRRS